MKDKDSTLTLLLSSALNKDLPLKERAEKIRDCARQLYLSSESSSFKSACFEVIRENDPIALLMAIERATIEILEITENE